MYTWMRACMRMDASWCVRACVRAWCTASAASAGRRRRRCEQSPSRGGPRAARGSAVGQRSRAAASPAWRRRRQDAVWGGDGGVGDGGIVQHWSAQGHADRAELQSCARPRCGPPSKTRASRRGEKRRRRRRRRRRLVGPWRTWRGGRCRRRWRRRTQTSFARRPTRSRPPHRVTFPAGPTRATPPPHPPAAHTPPPQPVHVPPRPTARVARARR